MRIYRIEANSSNNNKPGVFVFSYFRVFVVTLFLFSFSYAQVQVTDELGQSVILKQFPRPGAEALERRRPHRIVSVAPNITEILFALGLENQIVGVTDFCDYPPAAKKKPKIGGFSNPNLERIIALQPDLVIVTADSNQDAMTKQLERLKIPIYVINSKTFYGILTSIRHIGEVTGTVPQAEKLTTELQLRINQVIQRTKTLPKPKVLFLWSEEPLITAGQGTFTDSLISLAGGINIAHDSKIKYPKYSFEEIIRRQPEIIIVANMLPEQPDTTLLTRWQKWSQIPAVKNKRIYSVNSDLMARPAPRIVEGLEELAKLIHPEKED